ncbi:MAG: response regulator transcription factor [Reichenbachiella sp.]|uniref:response regulator transcription factor n=1 Tax=Reichenbachiella sp. TaxID=2184521 RepID=UPI002966C08E|nr:response regulator transcription factor [Reichenbachiella sp.]MDW3212201.1 response regulator transcription factor [Reichenbachiella sp.]
MKILIVENEIELLNDLEEFLKGEGYLIEKASSLAEAREKVFVYDYDLLVLDLGLPDGNGLEVLKLLKKEKPDTGVLILTARDALDDKLAGLDMGADDYMTKPFHLSELNARIKSILRRRNFDGSSIVSYKEIEIDTDKMNVSIHGKKLTLTRKEYEFILYLVINKSKVLTKESIAEHLWGDDSDMFDSFDFIYTHIKNLRKKLLEAGGNDYLKSVYGLGYKFEAD